MTAQLNRKAAYHPMRLLMQWPMCGYLAAFGVSSVAAIFLRSRFIGPLAFGGASLFVAQAGHEMWYDIFNDAAFLILGLAPLWALRALLNRWKPRADFLHYGAACIAALPVLLFDYRNGYIEGPRHFPQGMMWGWGMTMRQNGVEYFTRTDRDAVIAKIAETLAPTNRARVEFFPNADGLFFVGALGRNVTPFCPHFTTNSSDVLVLRTSRYIPLWWSNRVNEAWARIPAGTKPFYVRDQENQWYFADLRTNIAAPPP